MAMVYNIGAKSHDPRSKIGAVAAGADNTPRAMGYNGLPRGIDYRPEIMVSPEKYKWMCHAEENAILNAGRERISLIDCKLYVNLLPCERCARACIQSGITEVIVHKQSQDFYIETSEQDGNYWEDSFKCTISMFSEVGMRLRYLDYQLVTPHSIFNGKSFPATP